MKTWAEVIKALISFYPANSNYGDARFMQMLEIHNITERGTVTLENFKLLPHTFNKGEPVSTARRHVFNRVLLLTLSTLSPETLDELIGHLVSDKDRFYEESEVTHSRMIKFLENSVKN